MTVDQKSNQGEMMKPETLLHGRYMYNTSLPQPCARVQKMPEH